MNDAATADPASLVSLHHYERGAVVAQENDRLVSTAYGDRGHAP